MCGMAPRDSDTSKQRMPSTAERKAAKNEALWREVNDRIEEVDETSSSRRTDTSSSTSWPSWSARSAPTAYREATHRERAGAAVPSGPDAITPGLAVRGRC